MALDISQHRREEWCRPFDHPFLEALNRAKPDTLESFAAIWYRHNSEAGYYWEMLARHHYGHSFSYLPGALASPDITAIRTASSTHILSDLSTTNLCFRYPLCYNIITFHPGSYPAGHRFESYLSHTSKPLKQQCFEVFLLHIKNSAASIAAELFYRYLLNQSSIS